MYKSKEEERKGTKKRKSHHTLVCANREMQINVMKFNIHRSALMKTSVSWLVRDQEGHLPWSFTFRHTH
jgi:hypothetical protein